MAVELQRKGLVRILVNEESNQEYCHQYLAKAREVFRTAPDAISYKQYPRYFEVGGMLATATGNVELATTLRATLIERMRRVYDEATFGAEETRRFTQTLTDSEKELHELLVTGAAQARDLRTMRGAPLGPSPLCAPAV